MDNIIHVAILKSASNLTRNFSCQALAKVTMGYDVVKQLDTILRMFKDQIVVVIIEQFLKDFTDVWVTKQVDNSSFSKNALFSGNIMRDLARGDGRYVDTFNLNRRVESRHNLDSNLEKRELPFGKAAELKTDLLSSSLMGGEDDLSRTSKS